MAFCTHCGSKLEAGNRFCSSCGTMVAGEPAPASPVPEENVYSAPAYSEPEADAELTVNLNLLHHEAAREKEPVHQDNYVSASANNSAYDVLSPDFQGFPDQESAADPVPVKAPEAAKTPDAVKVTESVKKEKPARPRRKFLTAFCSVLICIFLVVLMLPTFTLLTVQNVPKQETLLAAMNRIDMDEMSAGFIDDDLEDLSFAEYLCDIINTDMENLNDAVISYRWDDMTPKTLNRFLKKTTFLSFFAEHMEGLLDAALSGDDSYTFSAKSVQRAMDKNRDYIVEVMNVSVSDREYDYFVDYMVDALELEIELPEMEDDIVDIIDLLRSFYVVAGLCLVMVLLVVLLFVTNRKDLLFAVKDTGISFVIGAGLFLLVILGGGLLASTFASEAPLVYLGLILVSCAAEVALLAAAGVLALGIILLLVNFIARKIQRKRMA